MIAATEIAIVTVLQSRRLQAHRVKHLRRLVGATLAAHGAALTRLRKPRRHATGVPSTWHDLPAAVPPNVRPRMSRHCTPPPADSDSNLSDTRTAALRCRLQRIRAV